MSRMHLRRRPSPDVLPGERAGGRPWKWVAIGAVGLVWGWFDAHTRTFTIPAEVSAGIVIAAVYAYAYARRRRGRPTDTGGVRGAGGSNPTAPTSGRTAPVARRTIAIWGAIITLAVAWELFALLHLPRHLHPTFSSLYVEASRLLLVRVVTFAAWLALGIWIVLQ